MKRVLMRVGKSSVNISPAFPSKSPSVQIRTPTGLITKSSSAPLLRPTSQRAELSVFREKGRLTSADIALEKEYDGNKMDVFTRKLSHSVMGELSEQIRFRPRVNGYVPSGRITIVSKTRGPLGNLFFSQDDRAGTFFLHSFEVIPYAQREGFGMQMLAEAIDILKKKAGAKTFILHVRTNNSDAIKLYKKFGFTIDTGKKYYPLNKGEMQMRFDL